MYFNPGSKVHSDLSGPRDESDLALYRRNQPEIRRSLHTYLPVWETKDRETGNRISMPDRRSLKKRSKLSKLIYQMENGLVFAKSEAANL
jgi:hypothetical protein